MITILHLAVLATCALAAGAVFAFGLETENSRLKAVAVLAGGALLVDPIWATYDGLPFILLALVFAFAAGIVTVAAFSGAIVVSGDEN